MSLKSIAIRADVLVLGARAAAEQYNVYFNFHTISSLIKHADYKAKVKMDLYEAN